MRTGDQTSPAALRSRKAPAARGFRREQRLEEALSRAAGPCADDPRPQTVGQPQGERRPAAGARASRRSMNRRTTASSSGLIPLTSQSAGAIATRAGRGIERAAGGGGSSPFG